MKVKDWLKYLIYIALLLLIIAAKGYVGNLFTLYFKQEYKPNYCYLVIIVLINICIGVALGLEHLVREMRKEGIWKINLPKLIVVGMPALYISLAGIWIYSGIQFLQKIILYPLLFLLKYGSGPISLFQLIFGYVVITSFYKCSEKI